MHRWPRRVAYRAHRSDSAPAYDQHRCHVPKPSGAIGRTLIIGALGPPLPRTRCHRPTAAVAGCRLPPATAPRRSPVCGRAWSFRCGLRGSHAVSNRQGGCRFAEASSPRAAETIDPPRAIDGSRSRITQRAARLLRYASAPSLAFPDALPSDDRRACRDFRASIALAAGIRAPRPPDRGKASGAVGQADHRTVGAQSSRRGRHRDVGPASGHWLWRARDAILPRWSASTSQQRRRNGVGIRRCAALDDDCSLR